MKNRKVIALLTALIIFAGVLVFAGVLLSGFWSAEHKLTTDEKLVYDALLKAAKETGNSKPLTVYSCSNIIDITENNKTEMMLKYFCKDGKYYGGHVRTDSKYVLIATNYSDDVQLLCVEDRTGTKVYDDGTILESDYGKLADYSWDDNKPNPFDYTTTEEYNLAVAIHNYANAITEAEVYEEYAHKLAYSGRYWITDSGDINIDHLNEALQEHWNN
ncbi:MAG: hypothetical protein IJ060_11420 [Oscillospiraceae bacterium]|nr:hypothetical protein [Oscillospiraceae bacterium]